MKTPHKTVLLIIVALMLSLSSRAQKVAQERNATVVTSVEQDAALQSTTFGQDDGYVPGNLDGQRGWITLGQPATIVSSSLLPLTQALQLAPGSDSWAAHPFTTGSAQALQFDIMMELFASSSLSQGTHLGVGNLDIGFILSGTDALARVEYPGEGGLEIMTFPQIIPANPDGSLGWVQIGLQLDYNNQLWSMSIDGLALAERLPLAPPGAGEEYNYLMLSAGESGPAQVASVSIGEIPPLVDTSMKVGLVKSAANLGNNTMLMSSQSSDGGGGRGGASAPGNPDGNAPDWTLAKEGSNAAGFVIYSPEGDGSTDNVPAPASVLLTQAMTSNNAPAPFVASASTTGSPRATSNRCEYIRKLTINRYEW